MGIDSFTKLWLPFDGVDTSTDIKDKSWYPKTATISGNAQVDTAFRVFGTGSLLVDGTGDWVTFADSSDFTLGSGNFTVDYWVRRTRSATREMPFGQANAAGDATSISILSNFQANDKMDFQCFSGGTAYTATTTATFTDTNWYYVAFVRNGNTITIYVGGTADGTVDVTGVTINDSASSFGIGICGDYTGFPFAGNIDEFRLSVGVARYTANFTPPTRQFSSVYASSAINFQNPGY